MSASAAEDGPRTLLRLGLLGSVTLVLALVLRVPAEQVLHRMSLPQGTGLAGVSGTLFHGSATQARLGGVHVGELRWRWLPGALLGAGLGLKLDSGGEVPFSADVVIRPLGYRIADLTGRIPVQRLGALQERLPLPAPLEGAVALEAVSLSGDDAYPTQASGTVRVLGLRLAAPLDIDLGDFEAQLSSAEDAGMAARVRDRGGPLDLQGRLDLAADGGWRMQASIGARPDAPESIGQALGFVGPAGPDGRRRMDLSGRFPRP